MNLIIVLFLPKECVIVEMNVLTCKQFFICDKLIIDIKLKKKKSQLKKIFKQGFMETMTRLQKKY